ncbi:cytochrome P450 [Carbonactinospora thermoautotrophica]|uniref:Cytochrome P450 n=1 Tax=Carbonactinospora thermoautotrophica TaxID=1469144 RepID=A0A132N5G4_9ACTN|nr:cytochrome P450 [Carbonactinospora thermoautotrophica]KWX00855.1 Cytochrome P450 [Carbonactinospora thermoautotrophica]KWX04315.1 cytochrome P450 [Carbonactinospora thermoautotrophica]KWX05227.1 cytochrome P450 [Carbonactinospora thermoautotrophica]
MAQQALRPFAFTGWSAEELANPYPIYRHYRENDPVHRGTSAGAGGAVWYVFGYDDVVSVLTSPYYGRNTRGLAAGGPSPPPLVPPGYDLTRTMVENWLVFMDPPRHTRLRALINKEFTPRVVAGLRGRVEKIAGELIASMGRNTSIDLVDAFAAPLPLLVISELLGISREHRAWFREQVMLLREGIASRTGRRADGYARCEAAARELFGYFRTEIEERRGTDRDDLIALLLRAAERGEPLTEEQLISTCIHLLIAGHETTTNLISKAVLALLAHPDVLQQLRSDPDLLSDAVDELIRYDPPVQMVTRWAERDQVLGGREIRRGDKVVLVLGSANRDPSRFPDPDVLRLRRTSGRHCGFGGGIHFCLGAPLARLEAEIGLRLLLENFPTMSLADEPIPYAEDIVFHGPTRLVLRMG